MTEHVIDKDLTIVALNRTIEDQALEITRLRVQVHALMARMESTAMKRATEAEAQAPIDTPAAEA